MFSNVLFVLVRVSTQYLLVAQPGLCRIICFLEFGGLSFFRMWAFLEGVGQSAELP